MSQHPFNPQGPLLEFWCNVRHNGMQARLGMALDTGATWVTVAEARLTALGYDLANVTTSVPFGDASQSHIAPRVTLDSFGLVGAEEPDIECLAYTLPARYGIDGVIGLNYLRRFRRVTLDFDSGVLTLER
jgi:predicted aspartyl protease